jgi:hypothetical protein
MVVDPNRGRTLGFDFERGSGNFARADTKSIRGG